jgi:hypothetical protein
MPVGLDLPRMVSTRVGAPTACGVGAGAVATPLIVPATVRRERGRSPHTMPRFSSTLRLASEQ